MSTPMSDYTRGLTEASPDRNGDYPDMTMVGRTFVFNHSGMIFKIVRIVFLADQSEWGYEMQDINSVHNIPIMRAASTFRKTFQGQALLTEVRPVY